MHHYYSSIAAFAPLSLQTLHWHLYTTENNPSIFLQQLTHLEVPQPNRSQVLLTELLHACTMERHSVSHRCLQNSHHAVQPLTFSADYTNPAISYCDRLWHSSPDRPPAQSCACPTQSILQQNAEQQNEQGLA
jgi:hypothetical protein